MNPKPITLADLRRACPKKWQAFEGRSSSCDWYVVFETAPGVARYRSVEMKTLGIPKSAARRAALAALKAMKEKRDG